MIPVAPRLRVSIGREDVIAKAQPPYLPLVAHIYDDRVLGQPVITRWRLTWRERIAFLLGRDLYVRILTFGRPFPPIHLSADSRACEYLTSDEFEDRARARAHWWGRLSW